MIKLKRIESILKQRKTIIIVEADGQQWLSDGCAFYPVVDLPKLTRDNVFAIFDIPYEKRENYTVAERTVPGFCFESIDPTEKLADRRKTHLLYDGRCLAPVITSQGLLFMDAKYLSPFAGTVDGVEIYERINDAGQSYFAVKSGFLLMGVILPVMVRPEPLLQELGAWSALLKIAIENENERKKDEMRQAGLFDEEGGIDG